MKFEIPFKEEIYKEQMTLNFNTAWKENLKKNKKRLIWAIPMILIGGLIIYGENYLGFVFIGIGIHYLINFYDYNSYYKKSKTKFFDLVEAEIVGQKNANELSVWEFDENYFGYKDYKYEAKINWEAFNNNRIIERNLFLDLNVGNNSSYVLGESEIGIENFQKITEFVKNKMDKKPVHNNV
ncbi:hypothetical protein PK35_16830 [Tamlana nanhaiensis]|uniref:YcxB-like protein domain-containing protein n=1 Tax=Neotamlana nanhaiensis TaxID=1382798 RepID=A0A0D7VX81_9FLAO|nr:hypothetical protein [Tamlana nanhaiensis]KJD31053.1 hypothetical protein PK35_16830 [Tamlana nanhaiensis]